MVKGDKKKKAKIQTHTRTHAHTHTHSCIHSPQTLKPPELPACEPKGGV